MDTLRITTLPKTITKEIHMKKLTIAAALAAVAIAVTVPLTFAQTDGYSMGPGMMGGYGGYGLAPG